MRIQKSLVLTLSFLNCDTRGTSLTPLLGHCQDQMEGEDLTVSPVIISEDYGSGGSILCFQGPLTSTGPPPPPHLVWLPEKNTPLLWLVLPSCWPRLHVETQSLDAGPTGLSLSVSSGAKHMNGCLQRASFESHQSKTKLPSLAAFFSRRLDTPGFSEGLCRYRHVPFLNAGIASAECWLDTSHPPVATPGSPRPSSRTEAIGVLERLPTETPFKGCYAFRFSGASVGQPALSDPMQSPALVQLRSVWAT